MRPSKRPLCDLCEYYVPGVSKENDRGIPVCRAFPEGIPDEILDTGFDHRKAFGDETILFSPAEGVTEEDIEEWEQEVLETEKMNLKAMLDRFQPGETPE